MEKSLNLQQLKQLAISKINVMTKSSLVQFVKTQNAGNSSSYSKKNDPLKDKKTLRTITENKHDCNGQDPDEEGKCPAMCIINRNGKCQLHKSFLDLNRKGMGSIKYAENKTAAINAKASPIKQKQCVKK